MVAKLQYSFYESVGNGLAKADVAFRRGDNILSIGLCDKIRMDQELCGVSTGRHMAFRGNRGKLTSKPAFRTGMKAKRSWAWITGESESSTGNARTTLAVE